MGRAKYPKNWKDISQRIRLLRHYRCEYCKRLAFKKNPLTVHHLDHDPQHNEDSNLVLLHSSCHLLFHSTFESVRFRREFDYLVECYHNQRQFKFMDKGEINGLEEISK